VFVNIHSPKDLRIKYFEVWGDSGPMLLLFQEHARRVAEEEAKAKTQQAETS